MPALDTILKQVTETLSIIPHLAYVTIHSNHLLKHGEQPPMPVINKLTILLELNIQKYKHTNTIMTIKTEKPATEC